MAKYLLPEAPAASVRYSSVLKKILLAVSALVVVGIVALVLLIQPYVATPKIRVENISSNSVHVTARWRDKEEELGELKPGSIVMFEVNDEAAMSFNIAYPDGSVETTTGVYFTSGTTIYVQVNSNGVKVRAGT